MEGLGVIGARMPFRIVPYDRYPVFALRQLIMLKALRRVFRCGNDCGFDKRPAAFDLNS